MDHIIDHGEYACSVAAHELVEGFGLAGLTLLDQFQVRYIDLGQSRFRFHNSTGAGPISFNSL